MAGGAAIALSNNDVAQLVWRYPERIQGCLGFAIYRKEGAPAAAGEWTPLPSWVGFKGQSNSAWTKNSTEVWPVQKFEWKDVSAERGKTYSYRIVPVTGEPSVDRPLQKMAALALVAGPVTLTPALGAISAYFNRGILSTQFLSHQVKAGPSGEPDFKVLTDRIDQPGDPLRVALAGQMLEALELLLKRATREGGDCYAALYELSDPELEQALLQQNKLHIILSNTGADDKENQPARQALHEQANIDVIDRFVPSGHIGHNKFIVYADAAGTARAVLLGSTNWTDTAICAQSNNALIVENTVLASAYLTYWNRLKEDTPENGKSKQGQPLRSANENPGVRDAQVGNGKATVWFSPNTPHARASHPDAEEATPPDLAEVFGLMENAKQAILFLEFQPGRPSVVDKAAQIANDHPNLFVRGAVTDPKAADVFNTTLVHRTGEPEVEVVPASAITDQFAFWQHELLKAGPSAHAIIHDKIVVIDPMSDDCVVVTGSHNQGYRASYNNDENLLFVCGHKALAQAYAVHVMDVYDHYRFRYMMQRGGTQAFSGLDPTEAWQDKYFDPANPASHESDVWLGGVA